MKRFLILCVAIVFLGASTVSYASSFKRDELVSIARSYENNLLYLVCGLPWEMPTIDSEFTPDEPLGVYVNKEPSEELMGRYTKWVEMYNSVGLFDSDVTSEDLDAIALSSLELLELSSVEFKYFFDYRSDETIQWYTIHWVDGSLSRGFVIWNNDGVVSETMIF